MDFLDSYVDTNSTELYHAGAKEFTDFIDLPIPMHDHCMLSIDDSQIFVLDSGRTRNAYIFNRFSCTDILY